MTARRTAAAVLGLALLLTSCSAQGGPSTVDRAERSADETTSAPSSPSPSRSPEEASKPMRERAARSAGKLEAGWGPTRGELDRARKIVRRMSLPALAVPDSGW